VFPVAVVVLDGVAVPLAGGRLGALVEARLRQDGPSSPWV
jgi:hypothetical protein